MNRPELNKRNVPVTFFIASSSNIKIEAVKRFIYESSSNVPMIYYSVQGASSHVNEQPVGENEILKGAINRVLSAKDIDPRGEVYISMENGIEWDSESETWKDYAIVLTFVPSYGSINYVKSSAVVFPKTLVEITYNKCGSFVSNTVGKTLQEEGLVSKHDDPHLDLTGVSRIEILKESLKEVISYLPQGIWLKNP